MSTSEKTIQTGYDYAKELYAAYGVDIDRAMEKAAQLLRETDLPVAEVARQEG